MSNKKPKPVVWISLLGGLISAWIGLLILALEFAKAARALVEFVWELTHLY
jgi:hypothetical protein